MRKMYFGVAMCFGVSIISVSAFAQTMETYGGYGQARPGRCWSDTDAMRGYGYWNSCAPKTAAKKETAPKAARVRTASAAQTGPENYGGYGQARTGRCWSDTDAMRGYGYWGSCKK
jgi:hypothetical protein